MAPFGGSGSTPEAFTDLPVLIPVVVMIRLFRPLPLLAAWLLVLGGCSRDQDVTVIKLGHALDPSHSVHQAMEHMAEQLEETSNGTMRIDLYPSEQLGTERQLLELLQIGSLDMTKVSAAVLEGFAREYQVFGLPYVFRDDDHLFAVLEGPIGREILRSSEDIWLRGLAYYDAGSRSFYTKDRPIRTPEDLRGLKIRTQSSPVAIQMVQQLGGSPTPISFGELYSALQQGIVDGAENNPPSFYLTRHYELCQYYSLDEHTAVPDVLLISTHAWEKLSPRQRQWLQEAATASAQHQKELWEVASREAMEAVREAGVEIIRPDKAPFREAVAPLYERYEREAPAVYALLEQIREVE